MIQEPGFHLAQVNVALAVARFDTPEMAGMVERILELNALAEASTGFVWRFHNPEGIDWLAPFSNFFDPFEPARVFFNMSIWRSVEDLRRYVFETEHANLWRTRSTWMLPPARPHLTLWWMPSDQLPTVEDGRRRLAFLEKRGATSQAFTFSSPFPPPTGKQNHYDHP